MLMGMMIWDVWIYAWIYGWGQDHDAWDEMMMLIDASMDVCCRCSSIISTSSIITTTP